jgi:uncharacterized membrane protein HdeD (DUF308 family)
MYGKYWWTFLVRGVLASLFGFAAIVLPNITLEALALFLAIFLIADGILSAAASIQGRKLGSRWGFLMFEGIAGIAIGIMTFFWPGLTVLAIILIIAFWAMITGVFEVLAAIKLRDEIEGEWLLGLGGVLSILFSVVLFVNPGLGAVAIIWLIGIYALIFGVSLIFLGMRLRKHNIVVDLLLCEIITTLLFNI